MKIDIAVEIEWPDEGPAPHQRAAEWLRAIINAGLAESDDNRGAYIAEENSSDQMILITGIQSAL